MLWVRERGATVDASAVPAHNGSNARGRDADGLLVRIDKEGALKRGPAAIVGRVTVPTICAPCDSELLRFLMILDG